MPFGAIGAAVAGSVVSAGIGAVTSSLSGSSQSGDISAGQQQANQLLTPYATTGTQATNQLANLNGLNGTDAQNDAFSQFQATPGYAYQKAQGVTAIDQGAASKGMLNSGGTIQAEQTLGTNLANQSFQQYYNNLNGLSSTGLTAATGEAGTDTSAAASQASIDSQTAKGIGTSLQSGVNNLASIGSNSSSPTLSTGTSNVDANFPTNYSGF